MPSLRVAYVDTETTGLSSHLDRIIEIAIVLAEVDWATGKIIQRLDCYQGLQDPGRRIPAEAMAVHGIADAMVRGQRIDGRKAAGLLAEADICLAHNSGFDKGFVAQVVPEVPGYTWGCTCRGIPWKKLYPSQQLLRLREGNRSSCPGRCGDHDEPSVPPRSPGRARFPAIHPAQENPAERPGFRDRHLARPGVQAADPSVVDHFVGNGVRLQSSA